MLAERVKEWTYEWKQEGIEQGIEQGMQKGMQKGEAGILLRLMHLKFGQLNAETIVRVESADADQLMAWSERILSATIVEEMFMEH